MATVLLMLALLCGADALVTLSLDGARWTATNGNGSIQVPATVPGGIYSDLRAAGVLPEDIYYRFNDAQYRWVSYENWTYTTNFEVNSTIQQKKNITIVFKGVDTIASIYLNGNYLGAVDNMFVQYRFSVEDVIQNGENTLEVRFQSSVTAAMEKFNAESYIVPPECVPDEYHGECHVNFLRKMQSSFSWDWGPAFPSVSIWKSVEILASNTGYIQDYYVSVSYNETEKIYEVNQFVTMAPGRCPSLSIGLYFIKSDSTTIPVTTSKPVIREMGYTDIATWYIPEETIMLWWPNGMGRQRLYRAYASCTDEDGTTTIEKLIGYRSIKIVQQNVMADPQKGQSFYIMINNVPVFAKGSNWIPSHVLAELSADEKRIRNLLTAAKDANMNMLRIWGGGLYESDLFYEIADELGIMIWHDLMFACNMYPTNPDFLENVEREVEGQLKRLIHHPSIVIWAGNNENEGALRDNWYGTGSNFSLYYSDYVKLYVDTIGPLVKSIDLYRPYLISSPSNGLKTIEEGYVSQKPSDPLYGDVHYYNYVDDGWNYKSFPIPRFASEYGFQSLPSIHTLSSIAISSDLRVSSDLMQRRQHHANGYEEMVAQISRHLPLSEDYDTEENFRTFVYFSQINQAMSTKAETEHYRRNRNKLNDAGEGYTMGALYWQLNDIWEAPSWSSIDFHGNWKMLHYYAKKFFADILVSPYITPEGDLIVSLISDLQYDVKPVTLNIYVYRWDSFDYVKSISEIYIVRASEAYDAFNEKLENILNETPCSTNEDERNECLLYFTLVDESGAKISPDNFIFPGEIKFSQTIYDPSLTVTGISGPFGGASDERYSFNVTISSNSVAPFVWLEAQNISGYFSDNGFITLQPSTEIQFHTEQEIEADELGRALSVTSVMSENH